MLNRISMGITTSPLCLLTGGVLWPLLLGLKAAGILLETIEDRNWKARVDVGNLLEAVRGLCRNLPLFVAALEEVSTPYTTFPSPILGTRSHPGNNEPS